MSIFSENPGIPGVPTPSGSNVSPTFQQIIAQLQRTMAAVQADKLKAGVASRGIPGVQSQAPRPPFMALPGSFPGAPTGPQIAQVSYPSTPGIAPGAGADPNAAGVTSSPNAGGGASQPTGTGGGSGSANIPGISYRSGETQMPYYQGGETGKGIAANAIIGLGNVIADKRRADDEKQYIQAEGLWTQILTAQQNIKDAAAQGLKDPADEQFIIDTFKDKKKAKMIQDTLGTISTMPGPDPDEQQKHNTPEARGARSGFEKFVKKVGGALGSAVDPRTQAQKMPAGKGGPDINQPGGVRWNFPAPTEDQIKDRLAREMITPEQRARAMTDKMGVTLPAKEAALDAWHTSTAATQAANEKSLEDSRKSRDADYHLQSQSIAIRNKAQAQRLRDETGAANTPMVYPGDPQYTGEPGWGPMPANAQQAALVKKVLKYQVRAASLSGYGKGPLSRNTIMALASIADPNFDESQYNIRQATAIDFAKGKNSQKIQSIEKIVSHFGDLYDAHNDLGKDYGLSWVNRLAQLRREHFQVGGYPGIKEWDESVQAISDELTKLFTMTGSDVQQIRNWQKEMNASQTDDEFAASLAKLWRLTKGQMDAIQDTWDRTFQGTGRFEPLLSAKARKTLKRIGLGSLIGVDDEGMRNKPGFGSASPANPQGASTAPGGAAPIPPPPEEPGAPIIVSPDDYEKTMSGDQPQQ